MKRNPLLLAWLGGTVFAIAACGSPSEPDAKAPSASGGAATSAAAPSSEAPSLAPQPVTPVIQGEPVVRALPYGLPGEIGFQTAIVFTVVNPSVRPLEQARFDVEVFGADGASRGTSDPQVVALAAKESRTIVVTGMDTSVPGDLSGQPGENERAMKLAPVRAKVTPYASMPSDVEVVPASAWRASNAKISCDTGFVGCEVSGRITWTGAGVYEGGATVYAVVRDKPNGKILAAGSTQAEVTTFPSGAPQPVKVTVTGVQEAPRGAVVTLTAAHETY